jgi:phosphoserine phosphatase RsbX
MNTSAKTEMLWSVAQRALPGENISGDNHLVAKISCGWLVSVVDGLGHGPEAAIAGRTFVETLAENADKPGDELIRLGHKALKNTRGGVAALVTIDNDRHLLSWLGVGNVEGILLHSGSDDRVPEYITTRGGIIGYRLPELKPSSVHLSNDDMLILATDGIQGGFSRMIPVGQTPEVIAAYILDNYAKSTDDALVLVARWHLVLADQRGD